MRVFLVINLKKHTSNFMSYTRGLYQNPMYIKKGKDFNFIKKLPFFNTY